MDERVKTIVRVIPPCMEKALVLFDELKWELENKGFIFHPVKEYVFRVIKKDSEIGISVSVNPVKNETVALSMSGKKEEEARSILSDKNQWTFETALVIPARKQDVVYDIRLGYDDVKTFHSVDALINEILFTSYHLKDHPSNTNEGDADEGEEYGDVSIYAEVDALIKKLLFERPPSNANEGEANKGEEFNYKSNSKDETDTK